MIRSIEVWGFKSLLRAGCRMWPFTTLVGPNASGKANLVDALWVLHRLATGETVASAIGEERAIEAFYSPLGFGEAGYQQLLGQGELQLGIQVDLELPETRVKRLNQQLAQREEVEEVEHPYTRVVERLLRYRVVLGMEVATGELYVQDETLHAITRDGDVHRGRSPFIIKEGERLVVRLERQGHPRYYPTRRPHTLLSELSDVVHHPHVTACREVIASWRRYHVEPKHMRAPVGRRMAADPGRRGQHLTQFLFGLSHRHPEGFQTLSRELARLVPSVNGLQIVSHQGSIELFVERDGGALFPARLVSAGTLRIIALLALEHTAPRPGLICYREPETGIDPRHLVQLAGLLERLALGGETQVLVTTHSGVFCNLVAPDAVVACRWDRDRGTRFEEAAFGPGDLFHEPEKAAFVKGSPFGQPSPLLEPVG